MSSQRLDARRLFKNKKEAKTSRPAWNLAAKTVSSSQLPVVSSHVGRETDSWQLLGTNRWFENSSCSIMLKHVVGPLYKRRADFQAPSWPVAEMLGVASFSRLDGSWGRTLGRGVVWLHPQQRVPMSHFSAFVWQALCRVNCKMRMPERGCCSESGLTRSSFG